MTIIYEFYIFRAFTYGWANLRLGQIEFWDNWVGRNIAQIQSEHIIKLEWIGYLCFEYFLFWIFRLNRIG